MKTRTLNFFVFFALATIGMVRVGTAQQVRAELSPENAAVGQPVRLTISVSGGRGAQVPQQLNIDGIDARFIGKSEQMQWQMNGAAVNSTSTSTYSYIIVPLRQGEFRIPSIAIAVSGKTLKTAPLTLRVAGGQGIPVLPAIPVPRSQTRQQGAAAAPSRQTTPGSPQGSQREEQPKVAFADLIIPKKSVYVGEVLPAELRFYFDAHYPVRLPDRPTFSGDGFTVMPFAKPIEKQQEVSGRIYNVVIFQTALSAAKAGTLDISPATMESQIQFPGTSSRMDDFFGGFFGNLMSSGDIRQTTVSTQSAKLEVKPLPKEGQPESFTGAIGQFSLKASAAPKQAAAGDPISLNVTVAGRGNFDAMGAPVLLEAAGWRAYPPGEKFEPSQSDPIGFNGEKHFEYMLVARQDQSKTPMAEFSFFDPSLEKYVTVRSNAIAVTVKGGADQNAQVAAASPSPPPQTTPVAATPVQDQVQLASKFSPASFTSFAHDPRFLLVNGALAIAWSTALLFGLARVAATSGVAKQSAARRNSRKLLRQMEDPTFDGEKFFLTAEQFVVSCLTNNGSNSDVRELLENSKASEQTRSAVRDILNQHDQWKYSARSSSNKVDASQRQHIVDQLKTFEHEVRR
ncbi:MAG TPA: BatD family protein [Terrimicrobiaceae bacterium]